MPDFHHPIQVVVQRTGLTAHVIRIWEKRYGAVEPQRTATNRRLYSEEQIERLNLLRELTRTGHSIGYIARLPAERLKEIAAAPARASRAGQGTGSKAEGTGPADKPESAQGTGPAAAPAALLEGCVAAVRALDAAALARALKQAEIALGMQGMLLRVAAPLGQALGTLWRKGEITAAHEHFASAMLRTHLALAAKPLGSGRGGPVLVVATPAGQVHELGALLAGALAANLGWSVTYLGASLPATEIVGAARQHGARAVALSLVYPADDPQMEGELTGLRELLPPEVTLIAGGQAVPAYQGVLARIGARSAADLTELGAILDGLRAPAVAAVPGNG